jgi:hypothetical protein
MQDDPCGLLTTYQTIERIGQEKHELLSFDTQRAALNGGAHRGQRHGRHPLRLPRRPSFSHCFEVGAQRVPISEALVPAKRTIIGLCPGSLLFNRRFKRPHILRHHVVPGAISCLFIQQGAIPARRPLRRPFVGPATTHPDGNAWRLHSLGKTVTSSIVWCLP